MNALRHFGVRISPRLSRRFTCVSKKDENKETLPPLPEAGALDMKSNPALSMSMAWVTTTAGYMMTTKMQTALALAPPLAFANVLLAPFFTIREIQKNKDVGSINCFPFLSMVGNCGVWSTYGVLAGDMTVLVPNGLGILAGMYFTYAYTRFGSAAASQYAFAIGMNAIAAYCAMTMDPATAMSTLGTVGAGTAIVLLCSPLVTARKVIAEKNASAMPFKVSFAMWLNAGAWGAYGWLVPGDMYIFVPNAIGFAAASFQLYLISKYSN